jgi:hypothetical protein
VIPKLGSEGAVNIKYSKGVMEHSQLKKMGCIEKNVWEPLEWNTPVYPARMRLKCPFTPTGVRSSTGLTFWDTCCSQTLQRGSLQDINQKCTWAKVREMYGSAAIYSQSFQKDQKEFSC